MGDGNGLRRSFLLRVATGAGSSEPESATTKAAPESAEPDTRFAPGERPEASSAEASPAPAPAAVQAVMHRHADAPAAKEPPETPAALRESIAKLTLKVVFKAEAPITYDECNEYFNRWKRLPEASMKEDFLLRLCDEGKYTDEIIQRFIAKMVVEGQLIPECEFALDIREDTEALARLAPAHFALIREFKCMLLAHAEDGKILVIGSLNPVAAYCVARALRVMSLTSGGGGEFPFVSAMRISKEAQLKVLENGR